MRKRASLLLGACQRDRPSTFYDRQFLRCDICDICHSLRLSMVKHNAIVDILDGGRRAPDTPEALLWGFAFDVQAKESGSKVSRWTLLTLAQWTLQA